MIIPCQASPIKGVCNRVTENERLIRQLLAEGALDLSDYVTDQELSDGLGTKADVGHDHSDYATDQELSDGLGTKADVGHDHSDYATDAELSAGLSTRALLLHEHQQVGCEITRTTNQSIPANAWTELALTQTATDTGGPNHNGNGIQVEYDGWYLVAASTRIVNTYGYTKWLSLYNNTSAQHEVLTNNTASDVRLAICKPIYLYANHIMTVRVYSTNQAGTVYYNPPWSPRLVVVPLSMRNWMT